MVAFISHASAERSLARRTERALERGGMDVWLDTSDIRIGQLLREELQEAIRNSAVVILLWSRAASKSRWVASEILTAFHLGRFVIPCAVDRTRLPYFLENSIHLDLRSAGRGWLGQLRRAVTEAPRSANRIPDSIGWRSPELEQEIRRLAEAQKGVLATLDRGDPAGARELQATLDPTMRGAERRWRHESMILNLAGYHRKNAYMLKHWAAISAGRPPGDRLLLSAERKFFDSLFADPNDFSALNGLGSVLLYERELDAAEFFVGRAIALARAAGITYDEAIHDMRLLLRLKASRRS